MMEIWLSPSTWTHEQWLVFSILAFVILAVIVMLYRLYSILKMARKKPYRPNLRPMRKKQPSSGDTEQGVPNPVSSETSTESSRKPGHKQSHEENQGTSD
ncbi:MAG: hypothetical protein WDZ76_02240 [Pseudohongiellaceae bacterium]